MKKAMSILVLLLISGCATIEKYGAILDTWVGSDINRLIDSWGYPDSSFGLPNGNTVYMYSNQGSYTMPTTYNSTSNYNLTGNSIYGNTTGYTTGGQTLNFWCKTFFEVNESQRIIKWRCEGNNCKAK